MSDPFADLRNKRLSELNEEQRDRAMELWLRDNAGSFGPYYSDRPDALFPSVFRVIDRLRAPIDMVLHCPSCGLQHIDASEPNDAELDSGLTNGWGNPPHRTHLCHGCGHKWRPADVPTNGVAAVKTKGKGDSPIVTTMSLQRDAARYRWHRAHNPLALLGTAWGVSKAACDIGADTDMATDIAMEYLRSKT